MFSILIAVFAADAAVNVLACALGRQKLRRISKVLLMPLLAVIYVTAARSVSALVLLALLFGWLGDIFMMYKAKELWLTLGIGSFGVGHVFYLSAMFLVVGVHPAAWAAVAAAAAFLALAVGFFMFVKKDIPAKLVGPSFGYVLLLCSVGAIATMTLPGGALTFAGAMLFLVSDSVLSLEIFRWGDSPKVDFVVMLTYISAQTLLIAGFC